MRNILMILTLCFSFGMLANLQAQSKKEKEKLKKEEKKWKARKKKMMDKPLKFKDMTEGIQALPTQNEGLSRQLESLKESLTYRNKQNKTLQEELDKLLADPNAGTENNSESTTSEKDDGDYKKGRIFKVQVSYMADDVDVSSGNSDMVGREIVDGKYKYTLGYFRDYWEAQNFKNHLREMGLKDAWIVSYVDNVRTDITEALTPEEIERLRKEAGVDDN